MSHPSRVGADRRRHPRFDLIAQVRVALGSHDIIMELSNISSSGALLEMGNLRRPSWIAIEQELEVGIVHPIDLDAVELVGRIVRIVEDHSGVSLAVEFTRMQAAAREGLERLLALAHASAPVPPPLPRS